jgi:hypothetical protein
MATYYVANYGNNANNGTSASTPWQTLSFALGAASGTNPGLVAGDTVWIAPGTYREVVTYAGGNGTSGSQINIYGDPTFSQSWIAGNVGKIRITNFTIDTTLPSAGNTLSITKDWINIADLCIDGYPSGGLNPNSASTAAVFIAASNVTMTRCNINTLTSGRFVGLHHYIASGKTGLTLNRCSIFAPMPIWSYMATQGSTPYASGIRFIDCIIFGGGTIDGAYTFEALTAGQFNDVQIYNNTILNWGTNAVLFINGATSSNTVVMRNNLIYSVKGTGVLASGGAMTITQSNNFIVATTTYSNVSPTTNSVTANLFDMGASRVQNFSSLPLLSHQFGSPIYQAGTATGAPSTDFYGTTWIGTPTAGAVEIQSQSETGIYQPTERNASTITIAPGSTSQSIELYLGATGLTASTAGLSARYNRTRTASVSIPLVARTIAQAWTSGGFAEVDSTNMPGVYRLDVPDAALAAGADDVTIVVRGASGTNGAVMTVKLSSGGLTSAQTAAAVWDPAYTSYTAANSMGARVLKTTVDNRPVVVGTSQHIHANVHAIVDSTIAADELSGALLHNGTDYISADLLTPVSAATSVHIGPYQLLADGLGADQPLDVNVGTATSIDVQVTDANGTGIDITGATVSAKVYNSGGTLVATYAGTATYADNGRLSFGLTTTVTATSGTYTVTVTRTTGATDTQIFGPLRLYVRPV